MGVTIESLFAHNLPLEQLDSIPMKLDNVFASLAEFFPIFARRGGVKEQRNWYSCPYTGMTLQETLAYLGNVPLEGPGGFGGDIFARTVCLSHGAYWHMFVEGPERAKFRRILRSCAKRFGAEIALYFPSNDPGDGVMEKAAEGLNITEIQEWLTANEGLPAKSFDDLIEARSKWAQDNVDFPDVEVPIFGTLPVPPGS